ncbi:MAG: methylmalonyl-CoA carboxyltransferase, partial [Actinomycetota bacterium]|nr:methylmalonyl-CoA carboxyltransferase [Actinomycetota bacterium]
MSSPEDISPDRSTKGRLAELDRRRQELRDATQGRAVERQHAHGKLTARERIAALLDDESFSELDALSRSRAQTFAADGAPYGDGVVTGTGTIDGRAVCVFSQDFTV